MLIGRMLERAADILDHIDLSPASIRQDLAEARVVPAQLYSCGEIIDRAADLCSESAGLVHDNERRWRTFRTRVAEVVGDGA
jgi:hypothetical protein